MAFITVEEFRQLKRGDGILSTNFYGDTVFMVCYGEMVGCGPSLQFLSKDRQVLYIPYGMEDTLVTVFKMERCDASHPKWDQDLVDFVIELCDEADRLATAYNPMPS